MGRPYSDGSKKNTRLYIRTSEKEEEKINFCCDKLGKNRSEVIRIALDMVYKKLKNE